MAANKTVYQVSTTSGSDTESEPDYHSDYDSDTQDWPDPEHEKLIEDFEAHLSREQQMAVDLAAAIDRLFQADPLWVPKYTKLHSETTHHSTCPEQASNLIWLLYSKIEMPVLQTLIRISFTRWAKKWTKFLISAYQRRKMGESELNPRRVKQYLRDIVEAPLPEPEPKPEPKPAKRKREETTPTKPAKRAKKPIDILQAHENHPETQDMPDWAVRVYVARKTAHYKQMNAVFPHLAKKL